MDQGVPRAPLTHAGNLKGHETDPSCAASRVRVFLKEAIEEGSKFHHSHVTPKVVFGLREEAVYVPIGATKMQPFWQT
jgi:hypothetical protein